jgi:hypothetical protein
MKLALGGNSATAQETRASERNRLLILHMSPLVSDLNTNAGLWYI